MPRRTRRRPVARVNKRARRDRTNIESADVRESRIGASQCSSPRSRNHGGAGSYPVVCPRTDSAGHPTHARLQNDLVNRCTADAKEHVVVHLETLNTFKNLDARTYLTLSQDERVVYKPISPIGVASAVATNARHSRALRSNVLKNVANNVRVFSSRILADVLVPVRVRPDQLNLTVKTTRDPVVIDLIAFGAALYVVATVLIVKITILHE